MIKMTSREAQAKFFRLIKGEESVQCISRSGELIATITPANCMFPNNVDTKSVVKVEEVLSESTAVVNIATGEISDCEYNGFIPVTCIKCRKSPSVGIFYEHDSALGLMEDRPLELCKKCSYGFTKK